MNVSTPNDMKLRPNVKSTILPLFIHLRSCILFLDFGRHSIVSILCSLNPLPSIEANFRTHVPRALAPSWRTPT